MRKKLIWVIIALTATCIDQLTKFWATVALIPYEPWSVCPGFNFTLAFNSGAAFSFLSQTGAWHRWFFVAFSSFMSIGLLVWIFRLKNDEKLKSVGLSLILGGAIGNLIDRALYGYVVDFIDVYYKNNHWPIFNMADTFISLGAFFLIIDILKEQKE